MNIAEMHVWFRQYAQQMGMQNVRAILPEQIDVFINTSISDVVNQLVRQNVGVRNDRVIADITKLNQVNALRSLYKVVELDMATTTPFMEFDVMDMLTGKMSNKYDNNGVISDVSTTHIPDYMYLIDCSINYKTTQSGFTGSHGGIAPVDLFSNHIVTRWFPVRIIDNASLASSLNDVILRNTITSPILVFYNDDTFELYIDTFHKKEFHNRIFYTLNDSFVPNKLRVSYLATPNKVKYATDIAITNIDCNLPESLHIDILKHAVDLYRISINGGLYNQPSQQQEPTRTEARPAADNN